VPANVRLFAVGFFVRTSALKSVRNNSTSQPFTGNGGVGGGGWGGLTGCDVAGGETAPLWASSANYPGLR